MGIICYARVSTADQNLNRQVESIKEYAENNLTHIDGPVMLHTDNSTGTNTERHGYEGMIEQVKAGKVDAIVVHSVSRLARSIRDLDQTVDMMLEHDTEVHIVSEGLKMTGDDDPYQRAMLQLLGVFAELEAEMIRQRVKEGIKMRMENEEYHHGPPPLGFEKNDGRLIEANKFDRVRTILELVDDGAMSKRKAAADLNTSRRTINRALDRKELYNL
jgi:DNA invertase Pin-like site-specific DNA recombinase